MTEKDMTNLNDIVIIKTYKLQKFDILNLDITLNIDCIINISITTDDSVIYRRIYMCPDYYKKWLSDSFPYAFIRQFINTIFLDQPILYDDSITFN